MKKLSIIVPTYNGESTIYDTVMSIIPQVEKHKEEVEFLIRDNGSTDNTTKIVQEIVNQWPDIIKYNRREVVIESDINYKESILMSDGEYFAMIGDDDLIMPGYMDYVLEKLNEYPNLGLLYLNRVAVTREYTKGVIKENRFNSHFEEFYEDSRNFILSHMLGPDFMSVNVVKRECYMAGLRQLSTDYPGYVWFSIILYGIKGYTCLSALRPSILQRYPEKRVWDDKKVLFGLYGKTKLFTDLCLIYPGIRNAWEKKRSVMAYETLYSVSLNRKMYKEYRNRIKPFLKKDERIIYDMLLFVRGTEYPYRLFMLLYKTINIFRNRKYLKIIDTD